MKYKRQQNSNEASEATQTSMKHQRQHKHQWSIRDNKNINEESEATRTSMKHQRQPKHRRSIRGNNNTNEASETTRASMKHQRQIYCLSYTKIILSPRPLEETTISLLRGLMCNRHVIYTKPGSSFSGGRKVVFCCDSSLIFYQCALLILFYLCGSYTGSLLVK